MSRKKIKIPEGEIHVIFEKNGQGFEIDAKMLWDALCEYVFKDEEKQSEPTVFGYPKETKYETPYDDENPDQIKQSIEEI